MIFTSNELGSKIKEKVGIPVIIITNFLDLNEIEEKGLEAIKFAANK